LPDAQAIDRVQRLFVETLNISAPTPDADLIDTGVLDSLALVELLFALEREFGVTIPLEELDIDTFRTVESIARLVDGMRAGAG
jgi:D-alanine--poly(phosphoribitol) ligase subunit 2